MLIDECIHGMGNGQCVLCAGADAPLVWISGKGATYHATHACKWLREGKRQASSRGAIPPRCESKLLELVRWLGGTSPANGVSVEVGLLATHCELIHRRTYTECLTPGQAHSRPESTVESIRRESLSDLLTPASRGVDLAPPLSGCFGHPLRYLSRCSFECTHFLRPPSSTGETPSPILMVFPHQKHSPEYLAGTVGPLLDGLGCIRLAATELASPPSWIPERMLAQNHRSRGRGRSTGFPCREVVPVCFCSSRAAPRYRNSRGVRSPDFEDPVMAYVQFVSHANYTPHPVVPVGTVGPLGGYFTRTTTLRRRSDVRPISPGKSIIPRLGGFGCQRTPFP